MDKMDAAWQRAGRFGCRDWRLCRYFAAAWLMAAGVGCGMVGSGIFAFTQTLAGSHAAGRWAGLQNGFANFAGVVAPALTGFVVDRTSSFAAPLAITAAVLMLGGLAWIFVVGRVEQVSWASKGENLTATATGAA